MMAKRHIGTPVSLLQRGHNNRERSEPRFDCRNRDIDAYFEELALDSRARHLTDSRVLQSFDPHRPIEPRRVLSTHKLGRLPNRFSAMRRFVEPRALRKLFEQLVRAGQFYSSFQLGYDSDIALIKNYATADVLDELWMLRVIGRKDPKTVLEGEDMEDDDALRESEGQFDDMKRDIVQVLGIALESTLEDGVKQSGRASVRLRTAKRMQEKIDTASGQILDLLGMVREGREHCIALLSELELLEGLIDPDLEKNKALYKSGEIGSRATDMEDDRERWET